MERGQGYIPETLEEDYGSVVPKIISQVLREAAEQVIMYFDVFVKLTLIS